MTAITKFLAGGVAIAALASAAPAAAQYYPGGGYGYGYGGGGDIIGQVINSVIGGGMSSNPYGYNQGYNQGYAANMRVTAITNVERRNNGLRVSGLLDSRGGSYPPYGQAYGYQNRGYAATGDLSFRCNVDYRGAVSNVRINRNRAAYNRGY